MIKLTDDTILYKFLNKETTEEENDTILRWVSASEKNRVEFQRIHKIHQLNSQKQLQVKIDVDKAWEKLNKQLPRTSRKSKIVYLEVLRKIAVAALVVFVVGYGSIWTNEHFFRGIKSSLVQFEAPIGEKSKIVLADGSHVWLNSQTILKYDVSNPRKVTLAGEAFFNVEKDRKHPFEVTTQSGMKVKVLGTKFNLRSFVDEPIVETTLEDGKVLIIGSNAEQLAVLKPGQQATYNIQKNKVVLKTVNPEIYSLWKNNELRFSDISFQELVPRIERWYGISINLDPKLNKDDRFTMSVKTESLRELLNMMQLTSKFEYEINGSLVKIDTK